MITNRDELATTDTRDLALQCLEVGVEASDPTVVLTEAVSYENGVLKIGGQSYDLGSYNEVLVVGGGKASGEQARVLEDMLGARIDDGIVVTVSPLDLDHIDIRLGDHPVPSERGVAATNELLSLVREADEQTLIIALITGGGSALLPAPAGDVTLHDLQAVTRDLLASGATIQEINAVRKHLSAIKGGGLARAASPATVVSLLMSDVVGDDLSVIASGPTVPDSSTYEDARDLLRGHDIEPPTAIADRLEAGIRGNLPETPSPDDPVFEQVYNVLTADGATPIRAAVSFLSDHPYTPFFLSSRIRGESREAAKTMVGIGEEIRASAHPTSPPAVVLSGGETTVTIRGDGTGGPNQEFALSAAIEQSPGITIAAIDTDGIDGASDAAGGIIDASTVGAREEAQRALANNDAFPYLRDRTSAIMTGPTGTNVNDFRVMVVDPSD